MTTTRFDWTQARLELVEPDPRPGLTPEQQAAIDRAYKRLADELERSLLETLTGPSPAPVTYELERKIARPYGLFSLPTT